MADVTILGVDYDEFEELLVGVVAAGFTRATFQDRGHALISCEGAPIRWRVDGSDPTSARGHPMNPGDWLTLDRVDQVQGFRAIARGAKSATLMCSFGR